ncbi:MAG TPA: hypothetical protein VFT16_04960 [Candidatus Saccharimonadales bacterium]|nr:hypothetical protein [Candidatus Saccharimonadales bacterium]
MYPEDQDKEQQPANRNLMGEAPQPFDYGNPLQADPGRPVQPVKPKGGGSSGGPARFLPWIISGVLLLCVIIFGLIALLPADKDNKGSTNNPSTNNSSQNDTNTGTASECSSKLRRYQNEDLDIRFCYPKTWGDVKLTDAKFDPSDSGTRVRLSFADKSQINLGLVSDDWSTDVARDGTCSDPATQSFPDTSGFSAKWVTEGTGVNITSAVRGLEVVPDQYLLQEHVDNLLTDGVCVEGYQAFGGEVYRNAMATYYAKFNDKVASPKAHIDSPTALVPVADRNELTAFVKSIEKY